jgi:hypothetical protein
MYVLLHATEKLVYLNISCLLKKKNREMFDLNDYSLTVKLPSSKRILWVRISLIVKYYDM